MKRLITSVVLGGAAAATSLSAGIAAADPDATTLAVPDPFGFTIPATPDFSYTADTASQAIAYAKDQTIDFNAGALSSPVEQFFSQYVTTTGDQPLPADFTKTISDADIINKVQDGLGTQQQIVFGPIQGTNIDSGVIGIHDFGDGYGYAYIDLVGPGTTSVNSDVNNAIGAFLVTPNGTYDVSDVENGGDYGGLAYLESQLFDFSKPLADPFGVALTGNPDFNYQTAGVFGNTAYGDQEVKFESSDLSSFAQKFFEDNVTISGQAFGPTSTLDVSQANIIDSLNYTGIDNGFATQQLFLPEIDGTNVETGVITLQNLGDGFSYDSIDLNLTGSSTDAIGAWLVTPYGDYDVSSLASLAAQMFDPNYFDIGSVFPADGLIPPTFDFLF
jgi:hypothetical protein